MWPTDPIGVPKNCESSLFNAREDAAVRKIILVTAAAPLLRVLERVVDLLPKAVQLRRSPYGRATRAGIDLLLADRRAEQRDRVLAGVVRHRLINRLIFYAHSALPQVARRLARLVPTVGPGKTAMRDLTTPLIVATAHFGPLFFAVLALEPMLRGRRVIVVLQEDALYLARIVPLLDRLGFECIVNTPHSIRRLLNALRDDSRTAVLFAFDSPARGRRDVGFLNVRLSTSTGIAYLADLGHARIITMFWLWRNARPRMAFDDEFEVDRSRDPLERRQRLLDQLYAALEARVVQSPEQWSAWDFIVQRIVAAPASNAVGSESR